MLGVIGVSLCLPQCAQAMLCVLSLCWFVRPGAVGGGNHCVVCVSTRENNKMTTVSDKELVCA